MSSLHRQHPAMIFNSLYRAFKMIIILIIFNLFHNNSLLEIRDSFGFNTGLMLIILTIIKDIYSYLFTLVKITDNHVYLYKSGLFNNEFKIKNNDIVDIRIKKNWVLSLFSVQRLRIYTASKSFVFKAMTTDDVKKIKYSVENRKSQHTNIEDFNINNEDLRNKTQVYKITKRALFVLSVVSITLTQLLAIFLILYGYIELINKSSFIASLLSTSYLYIIIILIILMIINFTINYFKYGNYKIYSLKNYLILEKGIFSSEEIKINTNQISSIYMKRTLLHRLFQKCELKVTIVGTSDREINTQTLIPLINYKEGTKFIELFTERSILINKDSQISLTNKGASFLPLIIIPFLKLVVCYITIISVINVSSKLITFISICFLIGLIFITLTNYLQWKNNQIVIAKDLYVFQYSYFFITNEFFIQKNQVLSVKIKHNIISPSFYRVTIFILRGENELSLKMDYLDKGQINNIIKLLK